MDITKISVKLLKLSRLDAAHTEFSCLPGSWARDIAGKFCSLVRLSDYCLLLGVQAGSNEITKRSEGNQMKLQGPGTTGRGSRSTGTDFPNSSRYKE